jgi:CRP-like cAMP-binding protein
MRIIDESPTFRLTRDIGRGGRHGTLAHGACFDKLSLLLKERRTASVKALTCCEVSILTSARFNRIRSEYPEFGEVPGEVSAEKTEMVVNLLLAG